MADDAAPIGGRGAPGRGSGTSPSAAARALAPSTTRQPGARPRPRRKAVRRDPAAPPDVAAPPESAEPDNAAPESAEPEAPPAAPGPVLPAPRAGRPLPAEVAPGGEPADSTDAAAAPDPADAAAAAEPGEPVEAERPAGEDAPAAGLDLAEAAAMAVDAAKEFFGEVDWERKLAEVLAFTRRRLTGDYEVDEYGLDREVTETFLLSALRPIAERWFRVEVHGVENIPAEGGALVVSNHSGTIPVDSLMTGLAVFDHTGRHLRALGADLVFALPFIGELARKGGATLASNEDAERMLSQGELVGVWPEGFKGIGKPFSERYKLQRFGRGGFVSAAMRTGVPIVPCSVVGAEEIYPLVGNVPSLARLFGLPYIPITPFFPWLGPLGMIPLPSKWHIEFGEPVRTDAYGEGAADDPMLVFDLTDQVRETIQQTLYSLLLQRSSIFT